MNKLSRLFDELRINALEQSLNNIRLSKINHLSLIARIFNCFVARFSDLQVAGHTTVNLNGAKRRKHLFGAISRYNYAGGKIRLNCSQQRLYYIIYQTGNFLV